eukprot:12063803-Alexandrium_andersonii.AAC.1
MQQAQSGGAGCSSGMHGVQQFGAGQFMQRAHSQSGGLLESGTHGVQQFEAGQFMQQARGQSGS